MKLNKTIFKSSFYINFIIGFVVFILLNIVLSKFLINKKIDLTEDKLFTLSANTKSVIRELNEQIKIQFFFSIHLAKIFLR